MTPQEKIQIGYYLCTGIGLLFGIVIAYMVGAGKSDSENEKDADA